MSEKKALLTGGAGFIGTNAANYFLKKGWEITILDNFSRRGTRENANWLKNLFPEKLKIVEADIVTNFNVLKSKVKESDLIIHLAGQVAVTTSILNPRDDFKVNALGTFNVLEALRKTDSDATLVYPSTNKVYGKMQQLEVQEKETRYIYKDYSSGIPESMQLDFFSPYGCSKGTGDQYVRDYERIYGLNTVVFRQSCIYGERQFGIEDQGWIAWFVISSILGKQIHIYGNGKQVRDVLYVNDLIEAYELAHQKISFCRGQIFNIGGGTDRSMSLLELLSFLEELVGRKMNYIFEDQRPGDQLIYISDISKVHDKLGWTPKTSVNEGVKKLVDWVFENQKLVKTVLADLLKKV